MKLLRTIQLDPSDTFVFDRAAEPGELAVPGGFMFALADPLTLTGKSRAAFWSGFLGLRSFGWSTLVQIVDASEPEYQAAVDALATMLVAQLDAPNQVVATRAAEEEVAFAASLCDPAPGTLAAVTRRHVDGVTRETFRTLLARDSPGPFTYVPEDGEQLDLVRLARC